MNDGSILEGKILNESDRTITIKSQLENPVLIQRKDILRVLYSNDYMNKVYIYKLDDTMIEGYVVYEDKDNYIIRENLSSAKEIILSKEKVNNISKKKIKTTAAVKNDNSPVGTWESIDDETSDVTANVKIYFENGIYYGKIIKLIKNPGLICKKCKGIVNNSPVLGLNMIWDLEYDSSDDETHSRYFRNLNKSASNKIYKGKIFDFFQVKESSCYIKREDNLLKVVIYAPLSWNRFQTWRLISE